MFVYSYEFSGMVDAFIHLASQQLSPNPHGVIPVERDYGLWFTLNH
jgi:hypothetical protein